MKKMMILSMAVLLALLISSCGNNASQADDHGDHGEHGGEKAAERETLNASFGFPSGAPKAGEETELSIEITNERGERLRDFEVSHEKLLHLIVVDHDLKFFNHVHPELQADGTFLIRTTFPTGGEYKLFADVVPVGGAGATLTEWVTVEGPEGEHAEIAVDSLLRQEANGKEVELSVSSMKPDEEVTLTFFVRDAATKKEINDLQPYLGAVGHVVILSADAERYIHVHPLDEASTGPAAAFATSFPQAGIYKIWGQFRHNDEVFTVPYVIDVK
ncbi:hypothetical protein FE782_16110 [Paenibacillus antri]|uniref:Secreted protein n=1 Tax=Paenibacillus antri TaxID=2582848 RepID=A0A5R9GDI6_9BACL|nr:hypothetical protein [Paenibacillus antri]TLS51254.1 hypothetical protein FE782_16110 [Paenibacillus antri]